MVDICFLCPIFHFWFSVTFGNEVTKILHNLYLHFSRQDRKKTEGKSKVTKISKTKRRKYGMNRIIHNKYIFQLVNSMFNIRCPIERAEFRTKLYIINYYQFLDFFSCQTLEKERGSMRVWAAWGCNLSSTSMTSGRLGIPIEEFVNVSELHEPEDQHQIQSNCN